MATGFTGPPVAPGTRNGLIDNKNVQRRRWLHSLPALPGHSY